MDIYRRFGGKLNMEALAGSKHFYFATAVCDSQGENAHGWAISDSYWHLAVGCSAPGNQAKIISVLDEL